MGRYIERVGNYHAQYGDYQWDYLKQNKPLEYYQKATFEIEVEDVETGETSTVDVPVLDNFIEISLIKKNYNYRHKSRNTFFIWLFNYAKERGNIYCRPFIQTTWEIDYKRKWKEFYLDSKLREPIVLKEKTNNIIELEDIEDLFWLQNQGITMVDWCDKKSKDLENED